MDLPGALASSIPAVVAVPALLPDWLNAETLMSNLGTFAFWAALAIIFAECGLFLFFMPGDSLLFVVGMFIATGAIDMSIWLACLLLFKLWLRNLENYLKLSRFMTTTIRTRAQKPVR